MAFLTNGATVRAYVNHGRWIADCERPHCSNAVQLQPGQSAFECGPNGCGFVAGVDWPPNAAAIWDVLNLRPVPQTRNWFPASHELALRANAPHGQTVTELIDEQANYEGLNG